MASKSEVSAFVGLANVNDPVRVGLRGLTVADNVEVTATGSLRKRAGRRLCDAAPLLSGYATEDGTRLYVQRADGIYAVGRDETQSLVVATDSPHPLRWTEFNQSVYFANRDTDGVISPVGALMPWRWPVPGAPQIALGAGSLPAGQYQLAQTFVMPDGRETGASPRTAITLAQPGGLTLTASPPAGWTARLYASGADSTTLMLLGETTGSLTLGVGPNQLAAELAADFGLAVPAPVDIDCLTACRGRLYAATFHDGVSIVWSSLPLTPHLWSALEGYVPVLGRVTMLADGGDALLIGTADAVYRLSIDDNGPVFSTLASYGVAPGLAAARDGDVTYIWTKRGVCRYPEFTNLTERRVSVPPGSVANAAVVHDRGQVRFLACLAAGGQAFNPYQ